MEEPNTSTSSRELDAQRKMNDPNSQLDDTVGRNGRDVNIEKALGEVVPLDLGVLE